MEVLRRCAPVLVFLVLPFVLGNKGCEEGKNWEHVVVDRTSDCTECHEPGTSRDTKPEWHDPIFQRDHGLLIRKIGMRTGNLCTVCHTQAKCTECHMQEKPRDHTQFFRLKAHGLEVGLNRSRCMTCHQADTCEACHRETRPLSHLAAWASPSNRHCLSCHYPLGSAGAQACAVCHFTSPAHSSQPSQPSNALHSTGAECRSCHFPLHHPDNGMNCVTCHTR
ncbi:MAG: hypothetical protein V1798_06595 [Pseudomonadota bacterium]